MATPGQPTLYKPEYVELAHNYCLLGATNETLGDFFGVTRRTVDNPPIVIPTGARSAEWRDLVMDPLTQEKVPPLRLATLGFGRDDGAGNDTQACMFWLRNRQRQYWQARAEAAPEFVDDDLAAALDAAGERLRHAAE